MRRWLIQTKTYLKQALLGPVFVCVKIGLMIIVGLVALGLCLGSFVNALVWRLREQETEVAKKSPDRHRLKQLSVSKGRSMCPHCKHEIQAKDLVPVLSWLTLGGKCRYCHKPISAQYPLVEALTAALFVLSYLWWPQTLQGSEWLSFGLWLVILTGLMALTVYDLRWFLLPNRIIFPLMFVAAIRAALEIFSSADPLETLLGVITAMALGGGLFYLIFQLSGGKWIGGGDVKLGWLLGLVVLKPSLSLLFIFVAAVLGSLVSVALLALKRLKRNSLVPFGPFLIAGAYISLLFGSDIVNWYQRTLLGI